MNKTWTQLVGVNFYAFNSFILNDARNTIIYIQDNRVIVVQNYNKKEKIVSSYIMPLYIVKQLVADIYNFSKYLLDHFLMLQTFSNVKRGLTMRIDNELKATSEVLSQFDFSFQLTRFKNLVFTENLN